MGPEQQALTPPPEARLDSADAAQLDSQTTLNFADIQRLFQDKGIKNLEEIKQLIDARNAGEVIPTNKSVEELGADRIKQMREAAGARIKSAKEKGKSLWSAIKSGGNKVGQLMENGLKTAVGATTPEARIRIANRANEIVNTGLDSVDRAGTAIADKYDEKKEDAKKWGRDKQADIRRGIDNATRPTRTRAAEIALAISAGANASREGFVRNANKAADLVDKGLDYAANLPGRVVSGEANPVNTVLSVTGEGPANVAREAALGIDMTIDSAIKWSSEKKAQAKALPGRIKNFFRNQADTSLFFAQDIMSDFRRGNAESNKKKILREQLKLDQQLFEQIGNEKREISAQDARRKLREINTFTPELRAGAGLRQIV